MIGIDEVQSNGSVPDPDLALARTRHLDIHKLHDLGSTCSGNAHCLHAGILPASACSMTYRVNGFVDAVEAPPIAEAMSWVIHKARNRQLLNLCQALPSYPPSPLLQQHVADAAFRPETSLYTEIAGLPELRSELARHMAVAYAGDIEAEDVLIAAGCNQAFCLALTALAGPGDNVVLPAPFYFNHQMWLAMQGIEVRSFSPLDEGDAVPQPGQAHDLIDGRTRAIVLVTPNNPTGAIFPPATVSAFLELARERGVALVIDETYKDFLAGEEPPHNLFRDASWREALVQLYSFSKVYALAGYRVGSVIAGAIADQPDCQDHGLHRDQRAPDLPARGLVRLARACTLGCRKAGNDGGANRSAQGRFYAKGSGLFARKCGSLFRLCAPSIHGNPGQGRGAAAGP